MITRRAALRSLRLLARGASWSDLVRTLSEPETGPPGDNLVSNEDSYLRVCGEVARLVPQGGVYLGVGPEQNFSLMACGTFEQSFLIDYRRRNLLVHAVYKALFRLSEDRFRFLERLTARTRGADGDLAAFADPPMDRKRLEATIAEVRRTLEPESLFQADDWEPIATIQKRLAGPGLNARFLGLPGYSTLARMIQTRDRDGHLAHVFARKDRYERIRDWQIADRIVPVVGNFAAKAGAIQRIGDFMRSRSLAVAMIYVSDVEFFLVRNGGFAAYVENLENLPRLGGAVIVRTSTRPLHHPDRVAGDAATTIVRDLAEFLEKSRRRLIRTVDDLFFA